MSNIVFIMDIDIGGEGRYASERRSSYGYSISSWRKWCDKNDCELFVLNDLVFDNNRMGFCWQRYYLFDILDSNDIEYDQVLMVDADTIVHPDCPNFFEETNGEYGGVMTDGCYEWVNRSISNYHDHLFKDQEKLKTWEYINGGFQIVNKNHKQFFQDIILFYWENSDAILYAQETFKVGTAQTVLNYLLKKYDIKVKMLPVCYNLQDMFKKSLLHIREHSWWPDTLDNLYNSGWVYHFNSIPQNKENRNANYWIERVYKDLYE